MIGIPAGQCAETAKQILQKAKAAKTRMRAMQDELKRVAAAPREFLDDDRYGALANQLVEHTAAAAPSVPDWPMRRIRSGAATSRPTPCSR